MSVDEKYSAEEHMLYINDIIKEENKINNMFYQIIYLTFTLPLIVNAGAVIALTDFFSKNSKIQSPIEIRYATLSFLMGVICGLIAVIYFFFVTYNRRKNTNSFWPSITEIKTKDLNNIFQITQEFRNQEIDRDESTNKGIKFCIFNALLSIAFCFLGIYFIVVYILNNYCMPLLVAGLLVCYVICSYFYLKCTDKKFKS